jgi:FtsH-binding integral membrane protein
MAGVEQIPSADRRTYEDAKPRNLQALVSLWSALAALVLLLMFQEFRGAALLLAVPVTGLVATVYGVVGLIRARRLGNGRTEAVVGLSLGITILVVTGIVSFYLWEISRSNWQF